MGLGSLLSEGLVLLKDLLLTSRFVRGHNFFRYFERSLLSVYGSFVSFCC